MFNKDLENLNYSDIQLLIDQKISESKTLDYKSKLPGDDKQSKINFLKDLIAFANTAGGYLIFGMRENKGVPEKTLPIEISNLEKEKLRLEGLISNGIEPRIHIQMKEIPVPEKQNQYLFVIKVHQSWQPPHWVSYSGHHKFYARNSAGNFEFDLQQLKNSFSASDFLFKRIKEFHDMRIGKMLSEETPVALNRGAKFLMHIVPFSSFSDHLKIEIQSIRELHHQEPSLFRPFGEGAYTGCQKITFEGLLIHPDNRNSSHRTYTHFYRSGIVETVATCGSNKVLDIEQKKIMTSIGNYKNIIKKLGFSPPIIILLSLIEIQGYSVPPQGGVYDNDDTEKYPFDRNVLSLPELVIENYETNIDKDVTYWFDSIWNACGYTKKWR